MTKQAKILTDAQIAQPVPPSPLYCMGGDVRARVLRRPLGGWGARRWRSDVLAWLQASVWMLGAWATCQCIYGLIGLVAT